MYDTILFDFDGTLAPSLDQWFDAFKSALRHCEVDWSGMTEEALVQRCFYRAFEDVAADFGIAPERQFPQLVQRGLVQAYASVQLFPTTRELLERCKQAGYTAGLVTSTRADPMFGTLARLHLDRYFDAVVTGSDITHFKPHPEPIQLALKRLAKTPDQTLFVGDASSDILAGRAAGTSTALFLPESNRQYYDFDVLRATGPDFIFSHHTELMQYLEL